MLKAMPAATKSFANFNVTYQQETASEPRHEPMVENSINSEVSLSQVALYLFSIRHQTLKINSKLPGLFFDEDE